MEIMQNANRRLRQGCFHLSARSGRLIVALLLAAGCGGRQQKYDATGVFEVTEIVVSSEASGRLLWFDAEEGMPLQANLPIGCVDTTQLYLHRRQVQARIKATQRRYVDVSVQTAALEQQVATAKSELRRFENLLQSNAATQKQVDDLSAQVALLEKQLAAQKLAMETGNKGVADETLALKAQLAQLDDQLKKCAVASPVAGTVLAKYAQPGELVAPGKALFKVANLENMMLRAYITSSLLTQVKIGQPVKVFSDFGEKDMRAYDGAITWIADKAEFTPKTIQTRDERTNLVYAIKITVKNDGYIKRGMYGEVQLENQ
ncbi:MAG: HlyD family efflux transporter periplasmic adaptor subunit [Prevotellaceae bacterium]|jgi:HlyD family secretion protein|nr:HlyD family efflux transporter periplasmic adaptor subunit [Prevotellaceae bacterium]